MRHQLEYLAVKSVQVAVRPLPLRAVRQLGERLGLAFYLADRVHRRIAVANLEAAFPARTPEDRDAIARSMFKHFGRLLLELLKYSSLSHDDKLAAVDFEGEDRVRLAYAQGKGILFCTGHFGFWEQQALAHALKFQPMAVMARPLDNPKLHDLLERIRMSDGNPVLYRRGAVRKALRLLAEGRGRGHPDRPAHDEPGRDQRGFFWQAGSHHVHAGGARHPDRRAGDSTVCVSAARRPIPHDLRAAGGAARRGVSGRGSRIHAALHRRPGNARQAAS